LKKDGDKIKVTIGSSDKLEETTAPEAEMEMELEPETNSEEMELTMEPEEVANPETEAAVEEDSGMEMTLGGENEMQQMETIVGDKVAEEQRINDANKSKRGPKGPRTPTTTEGGETTPPKEKEKIDLRNARIMEREIKRGTVVCPQGRIEKTEDGKYKMLLAPELSVRTKELKFEEVGTIDKLNDGKWALSAIAGERFAPNFRVSSDGQALANDDDAGSVIHDYVRVELHKPGRDKDVVESYRIKWAADQKKVVDEKNQRKATEKVKDETKDEAKDEVSA
jgi:hypothetical protein